MRTITVNDLKKLWFKFYNEKNYTKIQSSSVIPENDATVLFTTAGMHPLVPYLLGENHPAGDRLMNVQKCIRTNDIDEVGDDSHCTFFEMLGTWTLGQCDKKTAIKNAFEFLTSSEYLNINKEDLCVSCFAGEDGVPKDILAHDSWIECGLKENQIFYLPKKNNWWGLGNGTGPCGPDTEIFINTGKQKCCDECSPACDCGKYLEIWNLVFMQYNIKEVGGSVEELASPNIDTGMGLERTVCKLNGKKSVYDVGVLKKAIDYMKNQSDINYEENKSSFRIIADHLRASTIILGDDLKISPAPVGQGYVLRRLIRRSLNHSKKLNLETKDLIAIVEMYIDELKNDYQELELNKARIIEELNVEIQKFEKTLIDGKKEFEKVIKFTKGDTLNGKTAFRLYDTFGFPLELTIEIAQEKGYKVDVEGYKEAFKKHQEVSRAGAKQLFKGGLADTSKRSARLHTATHLLLAGLNKILGGGIEQRGSNITPERLRFDFNFNRKVTREELDEVENFVNKAINDKLPIVCEEMSVDEAKAKGATGIFNSKYGDIVKVFSIGEISKEICGGPHAENTEELKKFKIKKEESSSRGVRRIKAVIFD